MRRLAIAVAAAAAVLSSGCNEPVRRDTNPNTFVNTIHVVDETTGKCIRLRLGVGANYGSLLVVDDSYCARVNHARN